MKIFLFSFQGALFASKYIIRGGIAMKVHNAEIVISAVSPAQYPESELPEIALAGRSKFCGECKK